VKLPTVSEALPALAARIVGILRGTYPRSRTALRYESPLQILVATILSAQCTDARVNMITPSLFRRYPSAAAFAKAAQAVLEGV
jgi:endonuclease-3